MAGENGETVIQEKKLNGKPEVGPELRRPSWSDDDEMRCGLGPFKPSWMQCFASKQAFLVLFCITWVFQGMFYTYFVSILTTIEKLFGFQSKTLGVILSATEIGQISSSLLLTYFGGQGHRPRWMAYGMVLFAICALTSTLPHFIYGQQIMSNNASITSLPSVCVDVSHTNSSLDDFTVCKEEILNERLIHSKITDVVFAIFFTSLLGIGMGQTAVYTLGIPFIDDNVTGRESPLYFAITIGVRILGPAMGFIFGSVCIMTLSIILAPS